MVLIKNEAALPCVTMWERGNYGAFFKRILVWERGISERQLLEWNYSSFARKTKVVSSSRRK